MARSNCFNILMVALFLHLATAVPLNIYKDVIKSVSFTLPRSVLPTRYTPSTILPTWSAASTGLPAETSSGILYPIATGTVTPTVTASATGRTYAARWWLDRNEAELLALEKRRAFQGPRQHHHPHSYPYSPGCTTPTTISLPGTTDASAHTSFPTAAVTAGTAFHTL